MRDFDSAQKCARASARIAACAALASTSQLCAAPPSYNLDAAFADTRALCAAGDADIVCIGDSLTFRRFGMHEYLRDRFHDAYGDGGGGYQGMSVWTGGFAPDSWQRGVINSDVSPFYGLDGLWSQWNPSNGATSAFLAARDRTTRVQYLAMPGAGNLLADWSGGSQFVFCNNDELVVRELNVQLTGTDGRVYFYPSGDGSVTILGQNNISGQPGVRVHRAANGGWGVSAFLQRNVTFDQQLQLLGTDLFIIMLGQNDMALGTPEYRARMIQLIQRLQNAVPDAEVVLVSTYDSGSNQLPLLAQGMYLAAVETGSGFINLNEFGDRYAQFVAAGRIDPDGVHFAPAGGRYVANFVFDALHTNGASITAPCGDIDFNNDALFPDDSDLIDFLAVLAGGSCSNASGSQGENGPGCDSIDFDRNGLFPDDNDIVAFLRVLAGGSCE